MKKSTVLAAVVAALALVFAPVIGCGGDPPPPSSSNNDNGNATDNDEDNDQDNDQDNDEDPECILNADCDDLDGPHVCEDDQCVAVECTSSEDCELDEQCDDNMCVEMQYDCEVSDEFYGQIGDDDLRNGGVPTTEPFQESAGLGEIQDAIDDAWDEVNDADEVIEVEFDDPVEIEGAVVTATSFASEGNAPRYVWVEDADAALVILRLAGEIEDDGDMMAGVRVGQKVNFTVSELEIDGDSVPAASIFFGDPSVRGVSDWEVVEEDVDVTYTELGSDELSKSHFNQNVRFAGQIMPNVWDCGNNHCHSLRYGDEGQHETTFVSRAEEDPGECITFVGPALTFPGVFDDDAEVQADAQNFDWYWINF